MSDFVTSKLLNPAYLFDHGVIVFNAIYDLLSRIGFQRFLSIFDFVLFLLAIFFIAVISYSFIRVLEIRKKEHEHVHHEIEEYAHKHPETGH